jgi:DNA-binding CsgD family transcriptional regulator
LRLSGGRLAAASARDRRAWEMLLHRLARREGPAMGTAVSLGEATASPLRLLAVPLSGERVKASGLERPAASNLGLVVISEPQPEPATDQVVIETLFGLTKAEAALAAALASGETLRDYADASRRSLNTVKTHLKSVFAKTGTTRQAELVRLLGATAVVNRRDRD